ncbi:hypothetical protein ACFVG7_32915, partial [Streptomyces sp. NPDC127112]
SPLPARARPAARPPQLARTWGWVVWLAAPGVVEEEAVRGGGGTRAPGPGRELPPEPGAVAQPRQVQQATEDDRPRQVGVAAVDETGGVPAPGGGG